MNTTRLTLIDRVRDNRDTLAWEEFYRLYSQLIYNYARALGLNDTDASDIMSDCMGHLSRQMREFKYDRNHCKFRSFLKTVVSKSVAAHLRKRRPQHNLGNLLKDKESDLLTPDEIWNRQWQIDHLIYCWNQIAAQLPQQQARAFQLYVLEEKSVQQVTLELNITANQVYQAKTRITQQIKKEMLRIVGEEDPLIGSMN